MTKANRELIVRLQINILSDTSETYDVHLISTIGVGRLTFHAVSETDAIALMEKLRDAINAHSLERAEVGE